MGVGRDLFKSGDDQETTPEETETLNLQSIPGLRVKSEIHSIWHPGSSQYLVPIIKKSRILPQRSLWNQKGVVCFVLLPKSRSFLWCNRGEEGENRSKKGAGRGLAKGASAAAGCSAHRWPADSVLAAPEQSGERQPVKSHLGSPSRSRVTLGQSRLLSRHLFAQL